MNKDQLEKFSHGVRMLMLTLRSKDGGRQNKPDRVATKRITSNSEQFFEAYKELRDMKVKDERDLRIYSSVNPRNIEKAIHHFKRIQLDADYYSDADRHSFYYDIKNRWISSLMQRSSKAGSLFIVDIDHEDGETLGEALKQLDGKTTIVEKYPTKNGWHIVTEPFNPNETPDLKINPDGVLLLDY